MCLCGSLVFITALFWKIWSVLPIHIFANNLANYIKHTFLKSVLSLDNLHTFLKSVLSVDNSENII